jgi:hypothetical protein
VFRMNHRIEFQSRVNIDESEENIDNVSVIRHINQPKKKLGVSEMFIQSVVVRQILNSECRQMPQ